jgi:hypothetical protein
MPPTVGREDPALDFAKQQQPKKNRGAFLRRGGKLD